MANVTGSAPVNLAFQQVDGTGYLSTLTPPTAVSIPMSLGLNYAASGTAANQVDLIAPVRLSLASGTPQSIDLTAMTDIYGNAVAFAHVVTLAIRHNGTTDGQPLTVGGAGSTPWTAAWSGTITVLPGTTGSGSSSQNSGFLLLNAPNTTGYAVAGGSKLVQFSSGSATFTVDVIVIGRSV